MNNHICKAKSIGTGEWVQGYYVQKTDPLMGFTYTYLINQGHDEWTKTHLSSFVTWYEVDPDTICRHIGWNDRHDTPIFENDIVEFTIADTSCKYLVWWNKESNMMTAVPFDGIRFNCYDYYSHLNMRYEDFCLMLCDPYCNYRDIKVIGNLFDNPELMENVTILDFPSEDFEI